ncbi:MAG: putative sulfoacetate--CoA ligase [Chroococcopsis gigantea SAG 12.99]|jgi:acyl-CoA synthetase (AMP-forming)/AMP-acid ligase II|nr:AMP-binding protein [Chlorogloea purpurea SAG 13.99]MDV2998929.1 putative sulfoacetate--CoA ligase [Chroococcopsis gigantea SAG 12.99]
MPNSLNIDNIYDCLKLQAQKHPEKIALLAQGRPALTYSRLLTQIEGVNHQLQGLGISSGDTVAVALPDGPEMAVAFLSIASGAVCAPLNTQYRQEEFDFYLSDLNPRVLILQPTIAEPAREVARKRGIEVIELTPVEEAEAGVFILGIEKSNSDDFPPLKFSLPQDVALVLHTSGTTSRPKIVPLTGRNLCTSAHNISATFGLTPDDRALNIMPLFHIHGLIGVLLSSLSAGASVVCTTGFDVSQFFAWLVEFEPTWYSGVPTMHQTILGRVKNNPGSIPAHSLRFLRSSSAALPPRIMYELEDVFKVPAIESYGMTEASHQIASNPLEPENRKPGSVGMAAGVEVAIMDETGNLLENREIGEVVIRGLNVTKGYQNNPEANLQAFTDGWFRTGDSGYVDEEGYLFLKGRIKEIINRGGEKISPREVDEVLLDHPAIKQVVTFAAPHALLGEEVAAAIVFHENASATEEEIKTFVSLRLTHFKVPRVIVVVEEIPKGPTGKLQRIGLADKLGLKASDLEAPRPDFVPPRTPIEEKLVEIWSEILLIESVGIYDNFFQLGGDSISATRIANRIREIWAVELPFVIFFGEATIAEMALKILQTQAISYSEDIAAILEDLESEGED